MPKHTSICLRMSEIFLGYIIILKDVWVKKYIKMIQVRGIFDDKCKSLRTSSKFEKVRMCEYV